MDEISADVLPGQEQHAVDALCVLKRVLDQRELLIADERNGSPACCALGSADEHASFGVFDVRALHTSDRTELGRCGHHERDGWRVLHPGALLLVSIGAFENKLGSGGQPRLPIADGKGGKQAELLLYDSFPWELIEEIGVYSVAVRTQVQEVLANCSHRPPADVESTWYF